MKDQTVLFVDDENNVLNALKRLCRDEPFNIRLAHSGMQALEIMKEESIDLVVSDLRMPGMDGTELLTKIDKLYPDVPRVLLSGNADLPSVTKALNEGNLSYYVEKPWPDDRFRFVLRGLLTQQMLKRKYTEVLVTVNDQNEKLRKQAEKINDQSELKDRFFAVMSHEIRTPLNGIHGVLQILSNRDGLDDDCKRLVDIALKSSTDLGRIVNDVLDFSKIESGEMQLDSRSFSLHDMIQDIFDLMAPVADSKNIKLICEFNPSTSESYFKGDDYRIRQVIINLVNNAIKFTESGWVKICVPILRKNELQVAIEDTGIGIPIDRQELLFQEFKMLGASHARKFGGTGLGLSICKRLVDLMDGTIQVESAPAKGSVFTVSLPLPQVDLRTAETQEKKTPIDFSRKTILVVDDNETNCLVVESMLEDVGVQVFHVSSAEEALNLLHDKSVSSVLDLILMDISMPVMSGIEAARIIRERNLVGKYVPIIAMSAHVQPKEKEAFLEAGMNGFLGKPFQFSELINVLTDNEQDFCHEVFQTLRAETGDGAISKLVESFRRDAESRMVLLQTSFEAEDWKTFTAQSHALGSNAGMFGVLGLYRVCRKVESAHRKNQEEDIKKIAPALMSLICPSIEKIEGWLAASEQ